MSTQRVSIDLSLRNNFQSLPYASNRLDPAVDTKPRPIVPKVLWAINVLATENGVRSAAFATESVAPIPSLSNIDSAQYKQVEVIDVNGNLSYMLLDDTPGPTGTRIYYLLTAEKTWLRFVSDVYTTELYFPVKYTLFQTRTLVLWTEGDVVGPGWTTDGYTTARSFLEFNLTTKTVKFYPIVGSDQWAANWQGVASWGNYMIVYTQSRIYWSNPLNFADFVPAAGSAGSAAISEAQGPILLIVPNSRGLIIYCRNNVVYAEYSGDSSNPWIFGEVQGSEGILIYEGEPLVSRNEQSPYQVALTGQGIMFVTNQGVEQAPVELNNVLGLEYTEYRQEGKILRYYYPDSYFNQYKYNKVKRIDVFGSKVFVLIGEKATSEGVENRNRLMCFDLQTGDVAWIEGDIRSVTPTLNLTQDITPGRDQHNKLSNVVNSYLITKRVNIAGQPTNKNIILDFSNQTSTDSLPIGSFAFEQPELMIGSLQLRRGMVTNLYSVRLSGMISSAFEDEDVDLESLITVTVYENFSNHEVANEFVYSPIDKAFHGYATGTDLRVLIKGPTFKLTDIEFEVAQGGRE